MPIYEYECSSCGHRLEVMQKMSDLPLADCPSCTEPSLRKLVSAGGFVLKGSGWYATDFKGSSGKAAEGKSAEAKPEAGGKAEGKSESKADSGGSASTGASAAAPGS
jgi:putative FmdB family regulatory protein